MRFAVLVWFVRAAALRRAPGGHRGRGSSRAAGAPRHRKAGAGAHGQRADCRPFGADEADYYVLANVGKGAPQSVSIRRSRYKGKPAVNLSGGDARGLMYAALDTADRTGWSGTATDPFARVREISEEPYLAERGVSMFTMQRAYFESRLYDEKYWERYFDMLAASRINNFIVIFGYENGGFMAPLYPYFFNVPEYPGRGTGRHYGGPAGTQHGGVQGHDADRS